MKKIILCGGGTLGHFTPNIAIYENLKSKYDFVYIGTKNGLEKEIAKQYMPYKEIETAKLIRSLTLKNLLIPFKLIKGIMQAKKILKEQNPALIFSKGGFASIPVVMAGHMLKIPCITHESDLTLGLANKLIAKKCEYVCTSFEETAKTLKNGIYTGTPIRKQIFLGNAQKLKDKLKITNANPTILVLGGSLGSENINRAIRQIIPKLNNYNILHITGKGKQDQTIKAPNYYQIEYAKDIENYFTLADLVITRGGSNTLFELLALKKSMLIIPLNSKVSRGDQEQNAQIFKANGLANTLYEKDLTSENLLSKIKETLNQSKTLTHNMQTHNQNGTQTVCNLIEKSIQTPKNNAKIKSA
ncbi:MAG: UDP-N-acetylglucosamine--N-acetylmuramyl-(pentapeptide) pyrophosphoryl-undecaprenol N-acetylglucosamine transferase [Christensenellales bacterium]